MRITFENASVNESENLSAGAVENGRERGILHGNQMSGVRTGNPQGKFASKIAGGGNSVQLSKEVEAKPGAYQGKTKSGLMSATRDVTNYQNAMTIASNTMSAEDYAKVAKDGEIPSDLEADEAVTIVDCIKLAMLKSGKEVAGYTDTLDDGTIEEMTGIAGGSDKLFGGNREVLAEVVKAGHETDIDIDGQSLSEISHAYDELGDVLAINDSMKRALILSDAKLSIDNLYLAKHTARDYTDKPSGAYFDLAQNGYLAKKATSDGDISEEIKRLLSELDIEASEDNILNARWLVDNSVCIDEPNMTKLSRINNISLPLSDKDFANVCMNAIARGQKPVDAVVDDTENIYSKAVRITEEISKIVGCEETASDIVAQTSGNKDNIHSLRVFEEIRLKMTSAANLVLLRSGYSIDTKNLEDYVEALKKVENSDYYKETKEILAVQSAVVDIRRAPIEFVGRYCYEIKDADLSTLQVQANLATKKFEEAGIRYEEVATTVRKDLGDSIKKAFRNVDDLLKEGGFEVCEPNRRAVKILGYNSMPINRENLDKVLEADRKLSGVLNRLSPSDVIHLIRRGMSPMQMSIDELNDYIDTNHDADEAEMEKYSKFLYKLERINDISESERREFIDVYRLFHKLEQTNCAAVGTLLNQGRAISLDNLKTATKTINSKGVDVRVDSEFGLLVSEIRSELEPERLRSVTLDESTTLSTLYDDLTKIPRDENLERDYNNQMLREYRAASNVSEETITNLLMNDIPVSPDTLQSAESLMKKRGEAFKNVDRLRHRELKDKADELLDNFTDSESAVDSYDDMTQTLGSALNEDALMADNYIDVRQITNTYKMLSLAASYAHEENYEVPAEIDGQMTSINVRIVHNSNDAPGVVVTLETQNLGRISARLSIFGEKIEGYIAYNLKDAVSKCQKVADKLGEGVTVVHSEDSDTDGMIAAIPMKNNDNTIPTYDLYRVAKRFIDTIIDSEAAYEN